MGLVYKQSRLAGSLGAKVVRALFDTGASHCFIRKDVAEAISPLSRAPRKLQFETATGVAETEEVIFAEVWVNGYPLFWTFLVVPELSEELILGSDFFQRWKIRLDPEREEIILDPNALKLKLV